MLRLLERFNRAPHGGSFVLDLVEGDVTLFLPLSLEGPAHGPKDSWILKFSSRLRRTRSLPWLAREPPQRDSDLMVQLLSAIASSLGPASRTAG